jgi:hypothetical protein
MILFLIFLVAMAGFFAKVEIQIEGTEGWAKNLPTWKIESHWLLNILWGGRSMTGYHAWVFSFMAVVFHMPLFFAPSPTLAIEGRILGSFVLFWAAEDFLWFVFNPGFGIKRFNKENVPWHPRWVFGAPVEYWLFIPLGIALIYLSYI